MIIRFQNLGKIKETTLDLRPLTVIIGPNNSNKTYIAYSLYGLWQAERNLFGSMNLTNVKEHGAPVNNSLVIKENKLLQATQSSCTETSNTFTEGLTNFYQDSSDSLFTQTMLRVELARLDVSQAVHRLSGITIHLFETYKVAYHDEVITVSPEDSISSPKRIDLSDALMTLNYGLRQELFSKPFLLPAERNAFIITYKMLANRRYKALRESVRQAFGSRASTQRQIDLLREGGEVRYPQPVEDFLDFLTDVEAAKAPNTRSPFAKLADTIESSIQDTNKTRYRATALGGKEIITQVEKGLDIDLYNASSSIKQLAPLLLYLRYRAKENDLLIIDEPEMNLHPESQAKLLEVLAILVNHGVNVLLTTHSPYLMAHLNNLAQADDTSQAVRNRQAKSLYLKNPDSLLRMDQVSAYEMKDNQLQSLKDPDYGIRWDTLSDVSADLQQRYFAIYEEGHAKERARNGRKTAAPKNGQKERQPAGGQDGPDQP